MKMQMAFFMKLEQMTIAIIEAAISAIAIAYRTKGNKGALPRRSFLLAANPQRLIEQALENHLVG